MKVLITGATGFIGSWVAEKLLAKGYDVRLTVRSTSNYRWIKDKNYELCEISLLDIGQLSKATKDVDYIYHIAGNTSAKTLNDYINGNSKTALNLLESALISAPNLQRFLYVSSQAAVGPSLSLDFPVTVDSPLNPITDYGRSKKIAEGQISKYIGKIPFTIVRPPAVYGPRDTEILSIFKMIQFGIIPYIGFNKKMLSLVNVVDLSDGIIAAAESRNTVGKTYFISSEEIYDWANVYNIMKQALGKKITLNMHLPHFIVLSAGAISGFLGSFKAKPPVFNYQKGIDFIQQYWTCSVRSAVKDFNYRQNVSLEDGIRQTVEWYKSNGWL